MNIQYCKNLHIYVKSNSKILYISSICLENTTKKANNYAVLNLFVIHKESHSNVDQ